MSGGELNYLYHKLEADLFDWDVNGHYNNINDFEQTELAKQSNPMYDKELSEMMYDVICLLHGVEWYKSGDIRIERYEECKNKFKNKWFGKNFKKTKEQINVYKDCDNCYHMSDNGYCDFFGKRTFRMLDKGKECFGWMEKEDF